MKTFLKIEVKRVVRSWGLWVSIIIGLIIGTTQYVFNVLPMRQYLNVCSENNLGTLMPHSVFSKWIGGESVSLQHFIFFMIIPLLCVIPWSLSLCLDRRDGLQKNFFVKASKRAYYSAKYLICFLLGGFVSVCPLVLNLLLSSATLPSLCPEVSTGVFAVRSSSLWSTVFYTHPYIYILNYLILIFVFCGFISCFSLSLGELIDNAFTVVVFPFILYLFLYTIFSYRNYQKLVPFYFLDPFQNAQGISLWIIGVEAFLMLLVSVFAFIRGVRHETL